MGRFRIFLPGSMEGAVVELAAGTLAEASALASERRFLAVEMVDVIDDDGVFSARDALIAASRIQMIVKEPE